MRCRYARSPGARTAASSSGPRGSSPRYSSDTPVSAVAIADSRSACTSVSPVSGATADAIPRATRRTSSTSWSSTAGACDGSNGALRLPGGVGDRQACHPARSSRRVNGLKTVAWRPDHPAVRQWRRCTRARGAGAALLAVLLVALAGCVPSPSDGSPGSAGVPVIGLSRLSADQLVAFYNSRAHGPFRAQDVSLQELAQMFVDEGNRYQVRGDIAFAQSIVETGWFNYPDCDGCLLHPDSHNYAGIGACPTCGNGYGFRTPLAGVRAQIQLLRNMADATSRASTIPDLPVPELWGLDPATAIARFDNYSFKGRAPLWNDMSGVWATSPSYASTVLGVYNQMLTFSGLPGQCPADGLTFGPLVAEGPCPLGIRQPGRAIAN